MRFAIRCAIGGGAVLLALCAVADASAQTGSVRGRVTNAQSGEPIRDARVGVVGTNIQVATNAEGNYLIGRAPVGEYAIRVTVIGFTQQSRSVSIAAGSVAVADFALATSAITIDAVVVNAVTGREQRERELGTNVGAINVAEINPAQVTSIADVLSGRTEGVFLQDVNGTTGTSQRIRIRGANSLSLSNDPLVYIDGVRMEAASALSIGVGGQEASRLNDINPTTSRASRLSRGRRPPRCTARLRRTASC